MSKHLGQVFTPPEIVSQMLDLVGFTGDTALMATVLEPSFGEGVFLEEIVRRILIEAHARGWKQDAIARRLETGVRGIEIDPGLYEHTLRKLDALVGVHGLSGVSWGLENANTLDVAAQYEHSADIVVGNPPYVRIHDLDAATREKVQALRFASGMTDLYVSFYDLGLRFLRSAGGQLVYISPNSFLRNIAQGGFRQHLLEERCLSTIIDFRSRHVFPGAQTYTAIAHLDTRSPQRVIRYHDAEDPQQSREIVAPYSDYETTPGKFSSRPWSFGARQADISCSTTLADLCVIQGGVATNKDAVYICRNPQPANAPGVSLFNGHLVEDDILRVAIKGAKYTGGIPTARVLYPYEDQLTASGSRLPLSEDFVRVNYPLAYAYFLAHRDELMERNMKQSPSWFQYARSQGLKFIDAEKYVVGHVLSNPASEVRVNAAPLGSVVYSGLVVADIQPGYEEVVVRALRSEDFRQYVRAVGKDIAGGAKAFSARHVKEYRLDPKKFTE